MNFMTRCASTLTVNRLAASAWALAVLAAPTQTSAQTIEASRSNRCASLGEGFVAVAGSDACVRIGGHVRVEFGNGGAAPGGVYSSSVRDGVQPASERSHVRAGSGWSDLFPR
ncbi:MAG: hypothetical protein HYS06_13240 [Methylocystis sp.]|nr:hypothetical protein [Methylocystis sp.]MBI3275257.1 hypothetical protein [Methylocystis sp.]